MFIAQFYGVKDYESISKVASYVLRISCIVAVVFWIGMLFVPDQIMGFFTNEQELVRMGSEYLRVAGVSYVLSAIAQVFMTVMKNCYAVTLSSIISCVTVILNIILNALLIFGLAGLPALGVRGAALATVIATAVQMVWCISFCLVRMKQIRLHIFANNMNLQAAFWQKSLPVLLNELVWGGGFTMYSVILGHLGGDVVAANGIANISKNLVVCLCLGLGSAGHYRKYGWVNNLSKMEEER